MTTDLEKQFFSTFGIEPFIYCSKPRLDCDARSKGTCRKDCEYYSGVLYPQITDRILLELICLFAKEMNCFTNYWHTVEDLKKDVLEEFILDKDCFSKHQVQALFKEEK